MKYPDDQRDLILEKILSLLSDEQCPDTELERALGLSAKTVSNWRRGISHSYMRRLPEIAAFFGVAQSALDGSKGESDMAALSADETALLSRYREACRAVPARRRALFEALDRVLVLFLEDNK